jgi:DNA-binding phage protein
MEKREDVVYKPCLIENPDDFYIVQRLKDDEEVKNYLNNVLTRYDYWAVTRKFPQSRAAKGLLWKAEVLKQILIERGLEVPTLYDQILGFHPPVKKQKLTNGLQQEVREADQALKEQRARAARASSLATEPEDQTALDAIASAYCEEPASDSQATEEEGV